MLRAVLEDRSVPADRLANGLPSPNVRVIKVPYSARVKPLYLIRALLEGWDGVLVSGCHPGDCHYLAGNYAARRRFTLLKDFVEYFGLEPGRLNFSWVSASEGAKYAEVITTVVNRVKELGPARRMVKEYAGAEKGE